MNELQWNQVRMVPILHNRVEFALEIRKAFEEFRPDLVAVEYPGTLKEKILAGVARLPLLSVVYYEDEHGLLVYLPIEPTDAQVEAIRLGLSADLPVHFVDRDTEDYMPDFSPVPDPYAITRIGYAPYCLAYMTADRDEPRSVEDHLREKTMAFRLQQLARTGGKILFVCGLSHARRIRNLLDRPQTEVIGRRVRKGVGLAHLHRDSSREIMGEMPYLAAAYEAGRSGSIDVDRLRIQMRLIDEAKERYRNSTKETPTRTQIRILNRFARNYALLTGNLVPSFYQLIVAARGAVDDNFAYELWERGSDYPWQSEEPGLPVLRLEGEDLFLDQKRIRFHRQMKTLRTRLVPLPVRKKRRARSPEEWRKSFKGTSICSYPPEDVAVEGYGHRLRKKALEIKTEEAVRIEPFLCSMRDGVDVRETIRNWITDGSLYVREGRPLRGRIGSVVVIFDPDYPTKDGKEQFPWRVTWLGEHHQESDMAFYSTPAGEVMDGPGISRCQYGGFVLSYPPMRMYDIWRDPFFRFARNKPERLLMAGLDYSLERNVVYVAATPPSGWCQSMAARMGKRIIYLPIGTFSPVTLKKIREFHVLDGHHVRRYARDYI